MATIHLTNSGVTKRSVDLYIRISSQDSRRNGQVMSWWCDARPYTFLMPPNGVSSYGLHVVAPRIQARCVRLPPQLHVALHRIEPFHS